MMEAPLTIESVGNVAESALLPYDNRMSVGDRVKGGMRGRKGDRVGGRVGCSEGERKRRKSRGAFGVGRREGEGV
jgi:hypothetical protein